MTFVATIYFGWHYVADDIYAKIQAFANFGFAESHSLSFGLLVYASSWLKLHYPGAFLVGGRVDDRVAVVVEETEKTVYAHVNRCWLNHGLVEWF